MPSLSSSGILYYLLVVYVCMGIYWLDDMVAVIASKNFPGIMVFLVLGLCASAVGLLGMAALKKAPALSRLNTPGFYIAALSLSLLALVAIASAMPDLMTRTWSQ